MPTNFVSPPTKSDVQGKIVLVRVDYNVPLIKKNGKVLVGDDRRIAQSLETIHFLQAAQAKIILLSHLGRPVSDRDLQLSLQPIADHLKKKFRIPCYFSPEIIGETTSSLVNQMQPGEVMLLENLRFDPREKKGDSEFAQELAKLGDVYINEAFSTLHRSHTSTTQLPKLLPHFAGFDVIREVTTLTKMLTEPRRPFICLLGGAKIADKVAAIEQLAQKADCILIGGGIANNFFKAQGLEIYRSFTEEKISASDQDEDYSQVAAELLHQHRHEHMLKDGYIPLPKIIYPIDVIAAPSLQSYSKNQLRTIDLSNGPKDTEEHIKLSYLDIGPKTTRLYREIISQAETIFWNGPMGVWENPLFATGTHKLACAVADADATSIVGGGDTLGAIDAFGLAQSYSHISTGGGASLEFLSGKNLPGLVALNS